MKKKFKILDKQLKRVKSSRIKWLCAELKSMKICFEAMNWMGVPTNEEEKEHLKKYVDSYDSSIRLIEKDFISKLRPYVS